MPFLLPLLTAMVAVSVAAALARPLLRTVIGRLEFAGLLFVTTWSVMLGLRQAGIGVSSPAMTALWLAPVAANAGTLFVIGKLSHTPGWRPPPWLVAVFVGETVYVTALAATNDYHHLIARDLADDWTPYAAGFAIHLGYWLFLAGLTSLEFSRIRPDGRPWHRALALLMPPFAVIVFILQVLQIRVTNTLTVIALLICVGATLREGMGIERPSVGLPADGEGKSSRLRGLDGFDPVTQTLGRRALEHELDALEARLGTTDKPAAILMVDIDRFKTFNDAYGHLHGDAILRDVAQRVASAHPQMVMGRFGGDEFVALLTGIDPREAFAAAQLAAATVSGSPVQLAGGRSATVSVSIGVAICVPGRSWREWMDDADQAMYSRKRAGGNGVAKAGRDTSR